MHVISSQGSAALRRLMPSAPAVAGGDEAWYSLFMGRYANGTAADAPQAFRAEMPGDTRIEPHFHQVDQFQLFTAGSGTIGRHDVRTIVAHYADRHTGYGPIVAGPGGLTYYTLRAQTDLGAVFLGTPGYRERLKPSRKRHRMSGEIVPWIEPMLQSLSGSTLTPLPGIAEEEDGLGGFLLRAGPDATVACPDPGRTGGYYLVVINGAVRLDDREFPVESLCFVRRDEPAPRIGAGRQGLEALLLSFPTPDA